jgi:hypothetical protein
MSPMVKVELRRIRTDNDARAEHPVTHIKRLGLLMTLTVDNGVGGVGGFVQTGWHPPPQLLMPIWSCHMLVFLIQPDSSPEWF